MVTFKVIVIIWEIDVNRSIFELLIFTGLLSGLRDNDLYTPTALIVA